jgi:GT2 family glycosyltransferase
VISIVIVNWNSGGLLENCVRSLLRNAAGCQIIVVDNASTDSSLLFFEQMQDGPVLIRNSRNVGFAAGSNLGWRAGEGSLLLFLNPDTECFPGSIDRLEQTLIADKEVWAAGGRLISPSGTPQEDFNVRAFPSVAGVAAEMLLI